MVQMKVIELFSGIGGMQYALQDSGLDHEVLVSVDINTLANHVYQQNVVGVNIKQSNIQSLTPDFFNKLKPDMITMSPPCQPFTRVGLKKDMEDARSCPLLKFISILPELDERLRYILVENVQGFELSQSRKVLLDALVSSGFLYQELLLSPTLVGLPNSRTRYYLLAKRKPLSFSFQTTHHVMTELPCKEKIACLNPDHMKTHQTIKEHLEIDDDAEDAYNQYLVPDKVLEKRIKVFDVVTKDDNRSMCFTKAYSHYAEGTGSVYTSLDREAFLRIYNKSKEYMESTDIRLSMLKELRLRYFSPREVANLMCFPKKFVLPDDVTDRQGYRLLGNSINVHVVGILLKILCQEPFSKISNHT